VASEASFLRTLHDEADATSERADCVDNLPSDYDSTCPSCQMWSELGHCDAKWTSLDRACIENVWNSNTTDLVKDTCKKSCNNCAPLYTPCTEPSKQRCASPRLEGKDGINEERCKEMCDSNERCNFAFWNTGWFCALYETCDELESSKGTGTIFAKEGTTCPNDVCTRVKVVTTTWGNEISWTFGKCQSSTAYENNEVYTEECCQEAGSYELVCKDSYGDGWHGGYIEIEGIQYCKDFEDGSEKTEEATMGGEIPTTTPPPADFQCGMKPGSIVGGSEATAFSLPWQVALVYPADTTNPYGPNKPWCGGTLIGPQHVLTAAHCMGGSFDVLVGEHNASDDLQSEDGTRHSVCGTTSHPLYNRDTKDYDIAIVRLSQPVELGPRAVPACLPDAEEFGGRFLEGKTMTVSGWGRTVYQGVGSPVLKTIDVPGLSSEECQEKNLACWNCPPITDSMLCAESAPGGEDGGVCQGDSGGPLTITAGMPAREFVVGVVSWGAGCGWSQYPGVYGRVTHVRDWIDEQLAITC